MEEQAKIDYDAHQKALAISTNVIETAALEGELRGEAKGEAKGKAEEREKAQLEKETIVCNAFKKVNDVDFVAEITILSNDQVVEILKKYSLM
jgi:predicted transposase YdaD